MAVEFIFEGSCAHAGVTVRYQGGHGQNAFHRDVPVLRVAIPREYSDGVDRGKGVGRVPAKGGDRGQAGSDKVRVRFPMRSKNGGIFRGRVISRLSCKMVKKHMNTISKSTEFFSFQLTAMIRTFP